MVKPLVAVLGGLAAAICGLVLLAAPTAQAESRTPPEATQHALDELANCRARQGAGYAPGFCPTDTPVPALTATPAPRPSATPAPSSTPEPADEVPTATPLPAMPVGGNGYTRPLDDHWLELALQQGRWAVYQADDCLARVGAWANVVTQVQVDGEVDLISQDADCGLVAEQWLSDAPCSANDQGACDVSVDASLWDMLGHLPTPTATPADAPPPIAVPAAPPSRAPVAAAAVRPPAAAAQPSTVVVYVQITPTPIDAAVDPATAPEASATLRLSPSPVPSVRPTPVVTSTASATVTATATSLPTAVLAAAVSAQPTPAPDTAPQVEQRSAEWDWVLTVTLLASVGAIGAALVWAAKNSRGGA